MENDWSNDRLVEGQLEAGSARPVNDPAQVCYRPVDGLWIQAL